MTATIKKPKTQKTAEQKAKAVEAQRRYREKKKAAAAEAAEAAEAVTVESVTLAEDTFVAPVDDCELVAPEQEVVVEQEVAVEEDVEVEQEVEVEEDVENGNMIRLSVGANAYDNQPAQHTAASFEVMRETLLAVVSPQKGMAFFCAPLGTGIHDDPEKWPGEKSWRLGKLVLDRFFISFDCDGFGYEDENEDEFEYGQPTPAECFRQFVRHLSAFKGFGHTTSSSTPEEPRMRVTLALGKPVSRAKGEALGKALESILAPDGDVLFDPVVYRGEQPCYLPVQAKDGDGKPIGALLETFRFDGAVIDPDLYLPDWVEPSEPEAREVPELSPADMARADSALMAIPNDERFAKRDDWFKLMASAKEAGVSKDIAEMWSAKFDYKNDRKARKAARDFPYQWQSIKVGKAGGVGPGLLFSEAAKFGWDDPAIAEMFGGGEFVPNAEILAAVEMLAGMDALNYAKYRKIAAKHYKISVAVIDNLVDGKRATLAAAAAVAAAADAGPTDGWIAKELTFTPLSAAEDGAALLADLVKTIRRFVFCSEHVALAEAAWVMLTWMQADLDLMPRLGGMAPAMRCGKTRNQEVLYHLVFNPLAAVTLSTSVLYRIIAKGEVTLLLDEVDTWLSHKNVKEELVGIVNAGHSRNGVAWRNNPETLEPEPFPCYAPAALAGIGRLPPTITDRCLPLLLKRKLPGEQADKLKRGQKKSLTPLRARIHRWITDNRKVIADLVNPEDADDGKDREMCVIDLGNDRAEENWEPLLALAYVVGGEWSEKMRVAAKALELKGGDEGGDHLLQDIRELLASNPRPSVPYGADQFPGTGHVVQGNGKVVAQTLAAALRPLGWEKITPRGLGNLLKSYEIHSKDERLEGDRKKVCCYSLADLQETFKRYLKAEAEEVPEWLRG